MRRALWVAAALVVAAAAGIAALVLSLASAHAQKIAHLDLCAVQLCNPKVRRLVARHCSADPGLLSGQRHAPHALDTHSLEAQPSLHCYLLLGLSSPPAGAVAGLPSADGGDSSDDSGDIGSGASSASSILGVAVVGATAIRPLSEKHVPAFSTHSHLIELSRVLLEVEMATEYHVSDEDLALAREFCPVVYFDSAEKIRPMAMEEYVAASSLNDMKTGQVLQQDLRSGFRPEFVTRRGMYLNFTAPWRRMEAQERAIEDVPFYVKVDRGLQLHGQEVTSLLYMFFYPHDYGGLGLAGKRLGEHVADLEHIRVLVVPDKQQQGQGRQQEQGMKQQQQQQQSTPSAGGGSAAAAGGRQRYVVHRVHFAAHSFYEGRWLRADQVQYADPSTKRRVKAFPARNGHGSYAAPGRYVRLFGVAPDVMDGRGAVWNEAAALVRPYPPMLVPFRGKLSRAILNGPCQEWWDEWEPEVTRFCRLTGGFVNVFAKKNGRMAKVTMVPGGDGVHLEPTLVQEDVGGDAGGGAADGGGAVQSLAQCMEQEAADSQRQA